MKVWNMKIDFNNALGIVIWISLFLAGLFEWVCPLSQNRSNKIFKIACQTQQTCDLIREYKWLCHYLQSKTICKKSSNCLLPGRCQEQVLKSISIFQTLTPILILYLVGSRWAHWCLLSLWLPWTLLQVWTKGCLWFEIMVNEARSPTVSKYYIWLRFWTLDVRI